MSAQDDLTLPQRLNWARAALEAAGVEDGRLAAEFLLAHALGRQPAALRHTLLRKRDERAPRDAAERFTAHVARHAAGEPVAYILGEWEFYGLPLFVEPATLIPRPESEMLVDAALAALGAMETPRRLADLGAGTGCLTVAILKHAPGLQAVCVDTSPAALAVARRNVARHGLDSRVAFLQADYTEGLNLEPGLDFLISNPPYVSAAEYAKLAPNVREHEPCSALVPNCGNARALSGQSGLEHYPMLERLGAALLRPGGRIFLEMGAGQGAAIRPLFERAGTWEDVQVRFDLAGHDRLLSARRHATA